jgi:uncharacterized protein
MIIDAHAHVGSGRYKELAPEALLREMDQAEIQTAAICPVEEQIIIENRAGNDYLLKLSRERPSRFLGFAVANPWYGAAAVAELKRALGEGLGGVKFHPVIQGFSINDDIVFPLMDVAASYHVPVYIHSGTPHFGEPFKVVELARRYPETYFLMGHSGFSDFWMDLARCHQFAPNVYFETSRCVPSHLIALLNSVGADHIVFGSNLPESRYSIELESMRDVFTDPVVLDKVLSLNFQKIRGK